VRSFLGLSIAFWPGILHVGGDSILAKMPEVALFPAIKKGKKMCFSGPGHSLNKAHGGPC